MVERKASMISKEGNISINIKSQDVTWFNFLQYSRVTNSNYGGWNSKSYWIERALKKLSDDDFISKWTVNSIKSENPTPRKKDFMLNRKISGSRDAILKKLSMGFDLDQCSENDINTFISQNPTNFFNDYEIIGYEIPLSDEKDGQLKIDLLSFNTKNKGIGIIELKQSISPSNSPLIALIELFCYGIQLLKCKSDISKEIIQSNGQYIEEHLFENINLIIAAPVTYWKYWGFEDIKKNEIKDDFNKLIEIVNPVIMGKDSKFSLEFYKIKDDFSTEIL